MSKIHDLRQEADKILDGLEARAIALENKMSETNDQIADHLQQMKADVSDVSGSVEHKIRQVQELGAEQKDKLAGAFEQLRLQLALGRVTAKDKLEEQKQLISNAAQAVRAHIIAHRDHLDAELEKEIDAWIEELDRLDAEMAAAELAWDAEWRAEVAAATADLDARKADLKAEISAFQSRLKQRKDVAEDKLGDFHQEMTDAFNKIGSAFRNLAG